MLPSESHTLSSPLLADSSVQTMNASEAEQDDEIHRASLTLPDDDDDDDECHDINEPHSLPVGGYPCASPSALQVTAMISNFSTSYNVVNIALVLPILEELYTVSEEQKATCASSLLAGMMVGQLGGGALGDSFLGRLGALRVVMAFQIVASLATALLPANHPQDLFVSLAIWRFLLGIGAGGVYPLAAVLSAEQGAQVKEETPEERMQQLKRVVLTFSMQGVGFLAVPLLTVPLLHLTGDLNVVWRLVLGFGSIPGIVLAVLQYKLYTQGNTTEGRQSVPMEEPMNHGVAPDIDLEHNSSESVALEDNDHASPIILVPDEDGSYEQVTHPTSLWASIKHEPNLGQKLLGTAGTWFLFDLLFYGNTLFQPIVLETAFGGKGDNALKTVATDSLVLSLIALPGYILSALVIGKRLCYIPQTPRFVQMQGFVAMGLLYAIIGSYWPYLKQVPWLLVLLYSLTFFFANFGPNTTTFVFPSLVYAPDCRSTLNGISAAAGKAGALFGTSLFEPAARDLGDDRVMLICAAVSAMAFVMTRFFVRLPSCTTDERPRVN